MVRIRLPLAAVLVYTLAMLAAAFGIAFLVVEWRADDGDSQPRLPATGETATPAEITASEAEGLGTAYLYDFTQRFPSSDESAALGEGFLPFCTAVERTGEGWLVRCGFRHSDGREFQRLFDLLVGDDGTITTDEEES